MIIGFVLSVISARYLGPNDYGIVTYVESYVAFATSLCSLGINSIIIKKIVIFKNRENELFGTAIILRLIASALSSISIVMILAVVSNFSSLYVTVAILEVIKLVFQAIEVLKFWYLYKLESKKTSIIYTIAYVLTALYKLFLLATGKDIVWFAFSLSLDYIIISILLFIIFKKDTKFKLSFSRKIAFDLLKDGWHFIVSGLMIAIYSQTDKIMLKHFFDETYVSYYSVALTITSVVSFVLIAIIDSASSIIIDLSKDEQNRYKCERKIKQLYCFVFWFSISWSLVVFILSDYIIKLLYGPSYLESVLTLRILIWELAFSYLGTARNVWILINNKEKYVKHLALSGALINVILNFLLIPIMNSAGAALATLLSELIINVVFQFVISPLRGNGFLVIKSIFFINVINKDEAKAVLQKIKRFLKHNN